MIRLTFLLCIGLYLTALVLGADHGQKRYGLMMADAQAAAKPEAIPDPAPTAPIAVFVPAQPVMQAVTTKSAPSPDSTLPGLQTVALDTMPDSVPDPEPQPTPAPEFTDGLLFNVAVVQANVRGGPGRSFAVLDTVSRGEQVLVVLEEQPIEGWSRIRIEGDGVEGYISTKLLTRSE